MEDVVLVTPAVVVKPIDDEVEKARTTRTDDVLPPKRSVVSIADGMVIFILNNLKRFKHRKERRVVVVALLSLLSGWHE